MKKIFYILSLMMFLISCKNISTEDGNKIVKISSSYEIEWKKPDTPYGEINKNISEIMEEEEKKIISMGENFEKKLKKKNETSALLPFILKGEYEIMENNLNIYSILYKKYQYTGGAHGMTEFIVYNIDKKTGKEVELEKILGKNYQSKIVEKINEKIKKDKEKNIEYRLYDIDRIESLEGTYIYFIGDSAEILFPEYLIASYSSGVITFKFLIDNIQ
jgi:hypothetical protein